MDETVWSIAVKSVAIDIVHGLIVALCAGVAFTLMLKFMDWTAGGTRLKTHLRSIESDPVALAHWRGARMLSTALLMGAAWLAAK